MKLTSLKQLTLALGLALTATTSNAADHGHLNAGALGTNQNDQLIWANGADFLASSGYVKTLDYTNAGRYAGYFQQNITLTALPQTAANAGPDPAAAAPGSFIKTRLACLEAPLGGAFAFWENGATSPTLSVQAGETATNLYSLSQNNGSAGSVLNTVPGTNRSSGVSVHGSTKASPRTPCALPIRPTATSSVELLSPPAGVGVVIGSLPIVPA